MTTPTLWKKSSFSGGGEGNDCVEVSDQAAPRIAIRDSKAPAVGVVIVAAGVFGRFVEGIKGG